MDISKGTFDMAKPVILIAEDDPMISVMFCMAIEDFGAIAVNPVCRKSDAMSLLDETKIDGAVIDFDLRDGFATSLALELERKSLPFAIYGGNHTPKEVGMVLPNAPFFSKPVSMVQVIGCVFRGIAERRICGFSTWQEAAPNCDQLL